MTETNISLIGHTLLVLRPLLILPQICPKLIFFSDLGFSVADWEKVAHTDEYFFPFSVITNPEVIQERKLE